MACLNGEKGVELQLNAEKKTHTIAKPYPSFIPTIVYDEVKRLIIEIFPKRHFQEISLRILNFIYREDIGSEYINL